MYHKVETQLHLCPFRPRCWTDLSATWYKYNTVLKGLSLKSLQFQRNSFIFWKETQSNQLQTQAKIFFDLNNIYNCFAYIILFFTYNLQLLYHWCLHKLLAPIYAGFLKFWSSICPILYNYFEVQNLQIVDSWFHKQGITICSQYFFLRKEQGSKNPIPSTCARGYIDMAITDTTAYERYA